MKILKIIIVLIFLPLFLLFRPYEKVKAQEAPFIDADCGFKVQCIDPVNCMLDQSTNKIAQGTNSVKFIFDLSKIPTSFWNKYTFYDLDKGIPDILEKNLQTFPWAPKAGY